MPRLEDLDKIYMHPDLDIIKGRDKDGKAWVLRVDGNLYETNDIDPMWGGITLDYALEVRDKTIKENA